MHSLEIAVWELLFTLSQNIGTQEHEGKKRGKLEDKQPHFNALHKIHKEFTDMQHCEEQGIISILKG